MKFCLKADVCLSALILNFGIGWSLASSFTHPSPYLRGKHFGHRIIMRLYGLENRSGRFGEEEICCLCHGSNCCSSFAQSVA
jgi:hypothetical protein